MDEVVENKIEESGLTLFLKDKVDKETAVSLIDSFNGFYSQTQEWKTKAEALKITSIDQVQEMKDARVARLALVKVRTGIDKIRKQLNEGDKLRIETRNDLAKWLTSLVEPIEKDLEEKETFKEREEQKQRETKKQERIEKLAPYNVDTTFFDLCNMPEETFEQLVENSKILHEAKIRKEAEEKELAEMNDKINKRIQQISSIGFIAMSESNDHFGNESIGTTITLTELAGGDEFWNGFMEGVSATISEVKRKKENEAQIEAERLKKENARLQAEKDEQTRKENAEKKRFEDGDARQIMLLSIGFTITFDECADMDQEAFDDLYQKEHLKFQEEKNKKFIEEKKKAFEAEQERKKKEQEDAEKRRTRTIESSINANTIVGYSVIPAHEGTTDEIIPDRVEIKFVKVIGNGKEIDITETIHSDYFEVLEAEVIQKENL